MYAETGLMFPYFQSCSHELQQLDDYCRSHKSNSPSTGSLKRTSIVSDYDLGGEGDLFNAPEPILEETAMGLDPVAAVISMMSSGEDILSSKTLNLKAADIESIQSEVFYECEKGMLAMEAMETSLSDILDIKIPNIQGTEEVNCQGSIQKSVSSDCLSSMEDYWLHGGNPTGPNFFGFPGLDLGAVYGMRRAYSDGDIKTLGNVNNMNSPLGGQPNVICNHTSEERLQKLSRYRNKKTKRNFGRKIKYACRKALADSQPRIRGRFAKTEEYEIPKN
ncbi:uncharacterized protein LOC124926897 isoform X2 [Impatiens glandulifera]|uniref:uncharacterized protein LOC124926897 isoform X2 n=1 Tax=Impatiens glandulifera TaxID=253017 RepID=UPI001FB0B60A|nr:uncharacterized protein LOC124926897 isoform X2 [Impatiens glandulifera]